MWSEDGDGDGDGDGVGGHEEMRRVHVRGIAAFHVASGHATANFLPSACDACTASIPTLNLACNQSSTPTPYEATCFGIAMLGGEGLLCLFELGAAHFSKIP